MDFPPPSLSIQNSGSQPGTILFPSLPACRGRLTRSGDNLVVTLGEGKEGPPGIEWLVEAGDAAKHPTMPGTASLPSVKRNPGQTRPREPSFTLHIFVMRD